MPAWSELSVQSRFNRLMGIGVLGWFLLAPLASALSESFAFLVFLAFIVAVPNVAARLRCPRCHEMVARRQPPPVKWSILRTFWMIPVWRGLIPPRHCPHCHLPTKLRWGRPIEMK
jgi:hypothetical protein